MSFPPSTSVAATLFAVKLQKCLWTTTPHPTYRSQKTIVNCSFKATLRDVLIMSKTLLCSSWVVEEWTAENMQAAPGSTQVILSFHKINQIKKMF